MMLKRKSLAEAIDSIAYGEGENIETKREESWQECLVKALVEMPSDIADKVISALPPEVLLNMLQSREDPYIKLALLLLNKRR